MRIRSTKPEFWRSERIASVEWDDRLVLKGLESYVDDNGVGKDDVALITSDVFPRDLARESPGTLGKVRKALERLSAAGLVWRYEVDGTKLLYLSWWETTQYINKATKGRFRRPDGTLNYGESVIKASPPGNPGIPRETPVGTGEQGNRGTGETPLPPDEEIAPPHNSTPRKTGTEIALQRFASIQSCGSPLAREIVTAYAESIGTPIDAKTGKEITTVVDAGLQAGQTPEAIAAGIQEWAKSDSWSPSQIPKFITKAAAARRTNGIGKPTLKAAAAHNLAEELIAEMDQP